MESFCLSCGGMIHAKGCEGRCGSSAAQADKVGARRRQTQRAGPVWIKSFGLRLDRTASAFVAEVLDLVPNPHRQNVSS
jgi:hypothetical protein